MVSKLERKICGTCMFWSGKREKTNEENVRVVMYDEEAVCECPISSKSGELRRKDLKCKEHTKWEEI